MRGLVIGSILLLTACHAKIAGELQVDGAPFVITECRSGQALGFSGIMFADSSGRHLRLLANADGTTSVAIFPAGAVKGDSLGTCGTLAMQAQSSRINNIMNLKGSTSLSCEAIGHRISGKIDFENCH